MTALPAFMLDDRRHCRGSTLMWPDGDGHSVAVAIAVCRPPGAKSCPCLDECLQWALDHHEDYGVWGGVGMNERKRIHRPRAACDSNAGYRRHKRLGEDVCDDCRIAHNIWKANNRAAHPCAGGRLRAYPDITAVPVRKDTTPYECHHCGMWHATTTRRAA